MPPVGAKVGALFIRCSDEEADEVRRAAIEERRTVSGFILNVVLNRIAAREKLLREADNRPELPLPNIPRQV
jgi:hypothetical protein